MSTTITPNADQQVAIDKIIKWLDNPGPFSPTFSLAGLAGTGKSTIIPLILDIATRNNIHTTIACPTGKAASVVNDKLGKKTAKTIHQVAYAPVGNRKTDRKDHLGRDEYEPVFEEADFAADLVIVDEASMVSQSVYDRLLRNGGRFLFIGDHGQLPPVKDKQISPTLRSADHTLTEIVRQAEDSPIRKLAYEVRQGGSLLEPYDGICVHRVTSIQQIAHKCHGLGITFIVAATNKVRTMMNQELRDLMGFKGKPMFTPGERIIITSNNHAFNVCNGEMYTVTKVRSRDTLKGEDGERIICDLTDGDNEVLGIELGFQWRTSEAFNAGITGAELGYCLTCHKAQGSQANHVAVINERIGWMGNLAPAWRYTAATRAAKRLDVFTF